MSALTPLAVLSLPVVLLRSATPLAVLMPVVLLSAPDADGGVADARGVAKERTGSAGGVELPVVLLRSASTPLAVLWSPVVLLKSA